MIAIDLTRDSLCELTKVTKLLEERVVFVSTSTLLTYSYLELKKLYRSVVIPITTGVPVKAYSIDLFESIANSKIAIKDAYTIVQILGLLKLETINYQDELITLTYDYSRYMVNPDLVFNIYGVKPGVHPTQPIQSEQATDLIATMKATPDYNINHLWVIDRYFYYSETISELTYYLEGANTYIRNKGENLKCGCLDLSRLNVTRPIKFKDNVTVVDNQLILTLPEGYTDGVVLFVAGRPFFNITDTNRIVKTNGAISIPLSELNLNINYLGQWVSDFDLEVTTIEDILHHATSFYIAYYGELVAEYEEFKNINSQNYHIQSEPLAYDGGLLLDCDDVVVPFLTVKYPKVDEELYLIETYQSSKSNYYTKANYLLEKGKTHDIVSALTSYGVGLYLENRTNKFGLVKLRNLLKTEMLSGD